MFKTIDIRKYNVKLKATIQSSGKLNFTEDTARVLGLTDETYMRFGVDDEDDSTYYIAIIPEGDDNAFKINKSGIYYYLPGKLLFDALGLDYKNRPIMFDLIRMAEMDKIAGGEVYKLSKKVSPRKK
jgi:hypothetical protein